MLELPRYRATHISAILLAASYFAISVASAVAPEDALRASPSQISALRQRQKSSSSTTLRPESNDEWICPEIDGVSCSCDLPHTLRCTGGADALKDIGRALSSFPPRHVSLLDCTLQGVTSLPAGLLSGVALHGLVVSSGEIRSVAPEAFSALALPGRLQALGLPGNTLEAVPAIALRRLSGLERLDLSHNKLRSLAANSFQGVSNISFLDLSDNQLSEISPGVFEPLASSLRVLKLSGNRLRFAQLAALENLRALRELDLSNNALSGPLGPVALPRLTSLRSLRMAHNQLTSIRRGALSGLPQLSLLFIPHNIIDVLEDHAFKQMSGLTTLDLAHNRIVAVSTASLAHLSRLRRLSLQHNFLRALSADLMRPLSLLQELLLDGNDISNVSEDILDGVSQLTRFSLSDNPLNCDCGMAPFAKWLKNATRLPSEDRASAVCAAPPSLENGLLDEVTAEELLCEDASGTEPPGAPAPGGRRIPVSGTRLTLRAFHFDGDRVSLLWAVDVSKSPYACDALFVYEESGKHELLVQSAPLGCDSSQLADPRSLLLALPATSLSPGRRYRFCLVLLESGNEADESALVIGCSDPMPLVASPREASEALPASPTALMPLGQTPQSMESSPPLIAGLTANLTSSGALSVWVQLAPDGITSSCSLTLSVASVQAVAAEMRLNCSLPWAIIGGLGQGPFQVCVTALDGESDVPVGRSRCTSVGGAGVSASNGLSSAPLTSALSAALLAGSAAALLLVFILAGKIRQRNSANMAASSSSTASAGQLYRPPLSTSDTEPHPRYVKLLATTKV